MLSLFRALKSKSAKWLGRTGRKRTKATNGTANLSPYTEDQRERFMLLTADTFAKVSRMALDEMELGEIHLGFVYATNGALAIELYLKCLLQILTKQVPKTHNLKDLFNQLDRRTRHALRKKHDAWAATDPTLDEVRRKGFKTDLETLLDEGQDTFERSRYPHEILPSGEKLAFGLSIFGQCVRDCILDQRPHWIGESTSQAH